MQRRVSIRFQIAMLWHRRGKTRFGESTCFAEDEATMETGPRKKVPIRPASTISWCVVVRWKKFKRSAVRELLIRSVDTQGEADRRVLSGRPTAERAVVAAVGDGRDWMFFFVVVQAPFRLQRSTVEHNSSARSKRSERSTRGDSTRLKGVREIKR